MYLERIEMFDKKGPNINALITINAEALKEAIALTPRTSIRPSARCTVFR